jgi:site-specific recombinase XerD
MKQTQFAKYLSLFMVKYLVGERGCSINTIAAYRDTISLLIIFMRDINKIKVDNLDFNDITQERIINFLEWLETKRKCSISTRNARLAAVHSFIRFLIYKSPDYMDEWQRILSIKVKKSPRPGVVYLKPDGIKLLLAQPNINTIKGRRDLTLLSLMYECAGRVQEIADLTPSAVHFGNPTLLTIKGKGDRTRLVPLSDQGTRSLKTYMQENKLLDNKATEYPLFNNGRGDKLTRMAITAILKKYSTSARKKDLSLIPDKISPH